MSANQCREDGCTQAPMKDVSDGRCLFHSSSDLAKAKRQEGRSSGGKARGRKTRARDRGDLSVPDRPECRQDLEEWSAFLIEGVGSGTLSQSEADTLRKLLKDHQNHIQKAEEEAELEENVQQLMDDTKRLMTLCRQKDRKIEALQSRIRSLQGDSS